MKIFITGEAGLLAWAIKQQAAAFGIEVLSAPIGLTSKVTEHHAWRELNVLSSTFLHTIKQLKPDCIIHSAAVVNTDKCLANPQRCVEVNLHGTRLVLETCQKLKIPILYLSTTATYEPKQHLPLVETSLQRPKTLYGITKYAGECLVTGQNIAPWLVLRPCFIFGDPPRDHSSQLCRVVMHYFIKKYLPGEAGPIPRVTLDPYKVKDYMRVEDFARAVLMVIEKFWPFKISKIFNVSIEQARPMIEYFNATNIPLELEWVRQEDYLGHHVVSSAKLRESIDWQPQINPIIGVRILVNKAMLFIMQAKKLKEKLYYQ